MGYTKQWTRCLKTEAPWNTIRMIHTINILISSKKSSEHGSSNWLKYRLKRTFANKRINWNKIHKKHINYCYKGGKTTDQCHCFIDRTDYFVKEGHRTIFSYAVGSRIGLSMVQYCIQIFCHLQKPQSLLC